jgi:heterodisulfide reductase subunit D
MSVGFTRSEALSLETCVRCGVCFAACPVHEITGNPMLTPPFKTRILRDRIYKRQNSILARRARTPDKDSLEKLGDVVYSCSLCGRCEFSCPFNLENVSLFYRLRGVYHGQGILPGYLSMVDEAIRAYHNPYGGSQDKRRRWVSTAYPEGMEFNEKADVVYFVSCSSSYVDESMRAAVATSKLLDKLGLNWTSLEEEWCCGKPLKQIGDMERAEEFAKHNIEQIERTGAKTVVTSCPACRVVLNWEYPKLLGKPNNFRVLHTVQLLVEAVTDGRVDVGKTIPSRVTYHDPCNMTRYGGLVEEPRQILRKLSSDFVEMPSKGVDSRCCGGGGMIQAVNEELQQKLTSARLAEAQGTGASILATTCPTCTKYLSQDAGKHGLRVADLTELLVESL